MYFIHSLIKKIFAHFVDHMQSVLVSASINFLKRFRQSGMLRFVACLVSFALLQVAIIVPDVIAKGITLKIEFIYEAMYDPDRGYLVDGVRLYRDGLFMADIGAADCASVAVGIYTFEYTWDKPVFHSDGWTLTAYKEIDGLVVESAHSDPSPPVILRPGKPKIWRK